MLDPLARSILSFAWYDIPCGSVGGALILLLFFYLDGLVLLIGAEIDSEIDIERLGVARSSTREPFDSPLERYRNAI